MDAPPAGTVIAQRYQVTAPLPTTAPALAAQATRLGDGKPVLLSSRLFELTAPDGTPPYPKELGRLTFDYVSPVKPLPHAKVMPRNKFIATLKALDVKAAQNEVNTTICNFVRTVLGGAAVTCTVVRGERAPLKTLKVSGVSTADMAYHRLMIAKNFSR